MRKESPKLQSPEISDELTRQLRAAAAMPDHEIDLTDPDAPEALDWSKAVRGKYHRPVEDSASLHVDTDVLNWFRSQGPEYQARMNKVLRATMQRALKRRQNLNRRPG